MVVQFHPSKSTYLLVGLSDGTVALYDIAFSEKRYSSKLLPSAITKIVWAQEGDLFGKIIE